MLKSSKPIIFDLDDFCEEIMTPSLWDNLFYLKEYYPKLKVTMFTIPLKSSRDWLAMVNEKYDWIEMHYHGSDHSDRNEWFNKTEIKFPYDEFFYRGFKAPWWRMNQRTANVLNRMNFLISTMRGYFDVKGDKVYRFNLGQERIKSVWYENRAFHSFHSHVQRQKNKDGLPDIFDKAFVFPRMSNFMFVSELQ